MRSRAGAESIHASFLRPPAVPDQMLSCRSIDSLVPAVVITFNTFGGHLHSPSHSLFTFVASLVAYAGDGAASSSLSPASLGGSALP